MLCKNCGNPLREGAAFCSKCGTAVETNTERTEQEYTPPTPKFDNTETSESAPKKNSKKILIISLCVILSVIIVIVGVNVIFEINRPKLTLEKAYDAYIDILEKNRNDIEKNAAENKANNIAFCDCNDTGIPDMFYVVKRVEESRRRQNCQSGTRCS